jgi:hypothetical protein
MQMKSSAMYFTLFLLCLGMGSTAQARDVVVPAGTLMNCTLDEPKFSSATVNVGDPFLCYPRPMQQFGQTVFPRGSYLVGHLEAAKEPGHFVGKGYLRMAFDRLGLPSTDVPLTAKVVSVAGYNVDREGKVIGHGHATRDVVEWMLPPLWPWKILTLPARGPRPTLKGEVRITLRVMDDFVVPGVTAPGWHRFGEMPSSYRGGQPTLQPRAIAAVATLKAPATDAWAPGVTLFALTDGSVFPASQYWRSQDQLLYVSDGDPGTIALNSIDWAATAHLNSPRNVRVTLRNAPPDMPADARTAATSASASGGN